MKRQLSGHEAGMAGRGAGQGYQAGDKGERQGTPMIRRIQSWLIAGTLVLATAVPVLAQAGGTTTVYRGGTVRSYGYGGYGAAYVFRSGYGYLPAGAVYGSSAPVVTVVYGAPAIETLGVTYVFNPAASPMSLIGPQLRAVGPPPIVYVSAYGWGW